MNDKNIIGTWFKWGIIALITIVICVKFLTTDIDFSQIQFNFNDLLALILAIFAIWISINFYHKNNETSNKFYNNTYNFTKDISETLGRIEERFGEKLDSLKEENQSLSSRFDKYYTPNSNNEKDLETENNKEKEIEQKLQQEIIEKNKLLNEFTQKYQVAEIDKTNFLAELESKNTEVNRLNRKLMLFEKSNKKQEVQIDNQYEIPTRIVRYFRKKLVEESDLIELFKCADNDFIKNEFRSFTNNISRYFWVDLEKYDLADENRILTEKGLRIFVEIASIL
jgi:DNA repair exonuclease SbcCD ATPase subunit